MTKRRDENRVELYAAVNLNRNMRLTYCTSEATDRHEASRGLSATAIIVLRVSKKTKVDVFFRTQCRYWPMAYTTVSSCRTIRDTFLSSLCYYETDMTV